MVEKNVTVRYDLTTSPGAFPADDGVETVRVYANRHAHVLVSRVGTPDVATAMPIAAHTPEIISVPAGHTVGFILAENEVIGHIWVTGA